MGMCHGIRSIFAYLKAHGYTTSIYFMYTPRRFYSKHILNDLRVRVSNSNLIGISCLSLNAERAIQVIEFLKPLGIPIVWGGIHATLNPEKCLEYADIVCIGEGERAILDLLDLPCTSLGIFLCSNLCSILTCVLIFFHCFLNLMLN